MNKKEKSISRGNHKKTAKELGLQKGYVLHHTDTSMKHNDMERYIQWNIEDVEIMTKSAHISLHNRGISRFKGHTHTAETRAILSEIATEKNKGRHWFTDGEHNRYTYECPDGFHKGRTV